MNPPTSSEDFLKLGIFTETLAKEAMSETTKTPHILDRAYFVKYVDLRIRTLHANHTLWKSKIESKNPFRFLNRFVKHWFKAYMRDTKLFQQNNPL